MEQKITLPEAFEKRMKGMLGEQFEAFVKSYDSDRSYGLRRNPLKLEENAFLEAVPFELERVPWAEEGYYYKADERPGRHPLHEQGLYYIQEPSAMVPVQVLDPKPGEKILDLCAAPGGKTTMIAGRMQGQGLLIANEYVPNRAKILAQNVERMGICNAIVCNHSPQELAARFCGFFDRIVVDAPCSGEGMFHKEPQALAEWSEENVENCARRQREILTEAVRMLAPGGRLVYSTCTFAPQENEEIVAWLLATYPKLSVEAIDAARYQISPARPEFADRSQAGSGLTEERYDSIRGAARIWPHLSKGEGHFVACFHLEGEDAQADAEGISFCKVSDWTLPTEGKKQGRQKKGREKSSAADSLKCYEDFAKQYLNEVPVGRFATFGEQLYVLPPSMPQMDGLRVVRAGLHLGTCKGNRFEPGHAFALALRPGQVRQCVETQTPEKYIAGEGIPCQNDQKGWILVTYHGQPLGFGKASGGIVKNHYPKGLRRDVSGFFTADNL